jgi:hypothetical protein
MTTRPTPYQLVFEALGAERFPVLRDAVVAAGHDPRDRDAFVLVKEVVELLRELRPEEGVGECVDELVAFAYAAFVFWLDDQALVEIDRAALDRALGGEAAGPGAVGVRSYYLQLPSQRVWGEPIEGQPPEPLDGWFGSVSTDGARVLAVFGLHPGRAGFTAVQVNGPRPGRLARQDGTPLFAPRLEGGRAAGLHSVAGAEELLELAYRCHALLGPDGPAPGSQRLTAA